MRLVLPYPVSANRYWRSFVPRGGSRAIVCVSDEAKAYKREVAQLAALAGIREPIAGRVRVDIRLFPNRPKDYAKRARKDPDGWADTVQCLDLDNARKVLNDALKGIAFEDDKWIKADSGAICEPDEHGARVVVEITPIVRKAIAPGLFGVTA
ncbi:MAG TPA: RusA family crossover junction endodeoxyribonuclease [Frateuria sp.]|uniref:RusA family crossover junction endodeoxyribonuclease n=1 Tax=Frateuria sp. TaxID=2211372 RepID=UPI002DF5C503|nr:RusA family crossover junction endodeoxyribonuclease [Frateuria sp.]